MSEIETTFESDPELARILDTAMSVASTGPDVCGAVLLVFLDDRDAPTGKAVSLRIYGQVPEPQKLLSILTELLDTVVSPGASLPRSQGGSSV